VTEDEKQTSEGIQPEDTDGSTAGDEPQVDDANDSAAGPVAEDDSSSSQAAGEEPPSTPSADDASEEQPQDDDASDDDAPEAQSDAEDEAAGTGDEVAEEADQGSQGDGAPADGGREAEQAEKAEKKDVIPGADLEPIAVEPEAELSAEERARKEAEEEERARREAELTGEGEEETRAATRAPAKMESGARYLATGKRKSSIARVILTPGSGKIEVNQRALEEFFPRPLHQTTACQPLTTTGYEGSVDVRVRVHGGGVSGQAGAVRHGIARALTEVDPQLRGELKRRGFLTRDARVKERRKAGLKKARKRPQFSKR
jgi:small subunit ribosomal protein S9